MVIASLDAQTFRPAFFSVCFIALTVLAPGALAAWKETIARACVPAFGKCENRTGEITRQLNSLPRPYAGEASGTIGYLSRRTRESNSVLNIHFAWKQPVRVDAVAIVPMRSTMGGSLVDNYQLSETVEVFASDTGAERLVKRVGQLQGSVRQSLPVWIEFSPVTTREIILRFSGLTAMPDFMPAGLALSEVFIFDQEENVAPMARLKAASTIESFPGISLEYLNDEQTPLGLPQLPYTHESLGLRWSRDVATLEEPMVIRLSSASPQEVTGLRLFPVHDPNFANGFPVRFTAEFLDEHGGIVFSYDRYATNRFPNPGLNPVTLYCPSVRVAEIRLRILELWQPTSRVRPMLLLSEITPLERGRSVGNVFKAQFLPSPPPRVKAGTSMRSRLLSHWDSAHINDGLTQSGRILPLRSWLYQLSERRALLEELTILEKRRAQILSTGERTVLSALTLLIVAVVGGLAGWLIRLRIMQGRRLRQARDQLAIDLHDEVGSSLSSMGFHIEHLLKAADSPQARQRLLTVQRLTRESIYGLREVLFATSPAIGRAQNIVAHMRDLAQMILVRSQHTFEAPAALPPGLLTPAQRKDLILLFKEAISNAEHHSGCRQIDIRLTQTNSGLEMMIADDGCGMDEALLAQPGTLRTLKRRAASLGADLKIESGSARGTRLSVTIPLAPSRPA